MTDRRRRYPKGFIYRGISPEHVAGLIARRGEDDAEALLDDYIPLGKRWPEQFDQYLELFVRYCPRRPYHIKYGYEGGFMQVKRKIKATTGTSEQQGEPALAFDDLFARVLDPRRWNLTHGKNEDAPPIWVGLHAPKRTSLIAIDLDNKAGVLGYYHDGEDRTAPYRPIPSLTVDHLRKVQAIHDEFGEGMLWCISSATLGLHIWKKLGYLDFTNTAHSNWKRRLAKIGLGDTEVHPMPGRCFRRPFGTDYKTITWSGILTNWIDQLDHFVGSPNSPSFLDVVRAMKDACTAEWARREGKPLARSTTFSVIGEARRRMNDVDAWLKDGCPRSDTSLQIANVGTTPVSVRTSITGIGPRARTSPATETTSFGKGRWIQTLFKWAREGLPAEDSVFAVTSQLARWLYFIEFWHLSEDERIDLIEKTLVTYCKNKHNGFITRINQDRWSDVERQIGRIIKTAVESTDAEGRRITAEVRRRRASGFYRDVLELAPLMTSATATTGETSLQREPNKKKEVTERVISMDYSPLPENVEREIRRHYEKQKKELQARRMQSITAFLNYVWTNGGQVRLSIHSLKKLGLNGHRARLHLRRLRSMGLIDLGSYSKAAKLGREFWLTERCRTAFEAGRGRSGGS